MINGEPGVAADIAARVAQAVERLDYRHDFAASALRRTDRRSATIGMVLEDLGNPYSAAVLRAVEDVARTRGLLVLAGSYDDDQERERTLVAAFTSRRVDALVIMPAGDDHSYLLNERRAGTPIVFIDRPPAFLDADAVVVDNATGTRLGVRHLIGHGHRRIAFLGDLQSISTARQRHDGYRRSWRPRVCRSTRRWCGVDLRGHRGGRGGGPGCWRCPIRPPPSSPPRTCSPSGPCGPCAGAGRHRHVALVGFDDILLADLLDPAITVIAQDPARIGRLAAEVLFRRLDGDRSPTASHVVPTRLMPRGSGEIPAPRFDRPAGVVLKAHSSPFDTPLRDRSRRQPAATAPAARGARPHGVVQPGRPGGRAPAVPAPRRPLPRFGPDLAVGGGGVGRGRPPRRRPWPVTGGGGPARSGPWWGGNGSTPPSAAPTA